MDAQQRKQFRLMVYETKGQAYQNLFVNVMSYKESNFQPIKADGQIGDRKNDGWVPSTGRYYQVYAPEELRFQTKSAIKKMRADFMGLREYWDDFNKIKEFYFVVNDQFRGVSPLMFSALAGLQKEYGLEFADVIGASQLENMIASLDREQIECLVGPPLPSMSMTERINDNKRIRDFLERVYPYCSLLSDRQDDAGYSFPVCIYKFVNDFFDLSDPKEFSALLSGDDEALLHQYALMGSMLAMVQQIDDDERYENSGGSSYKLTFPFGAPERSEVIGAMNRSMLARVNAMISAFNSLVEHVTKLPNLNRGSLLHIQKFHNQSFS